MEIKFYMVVNGEKKTVPATAGVTFEISRENVENGAVYKPVIRNNTSDEIYLDAWGADCTGFDNAGADWNIFYDMGSCGWCGVKRLSYLEVNPRMGVVEEQKVSVNDVEQSPVYHRSDMHTVLWDNANKAATLIGFTLQREGGNNVRIIPDNTGKAVFAVTAAQGLGKRLASGEIYMPDTMVVTFGSNPYTLLEDYAGFVKAAHGRVFSDTPIVGMMSWYGYHTSVTEDIIRENAAIIGDLFSGYPQPMQPIMLIDHGWQHDACWGDFRVDADRFSHGLKALSDDIGKYGVELGLWHTPFCISWNAPNLEELKPIMNKDSNGEIIESNACVWGDLPGHEPKLYPIWFFNGGLPEVQERWVNEFKQLSEWGVVYVKMDFFALTADSRHGISHGDLYKMSWANFRKGGGEDIHLAPCSCATNMQAGYCDSIRIGSDIGCAGNWPGAMEHYVYGHSTLGALWYKNRKFWVNDGDSIQVAKGCSLNEARMRLTTVAMTGGHFMLSEDLRHVDTTRIEMIRRMLPAQPKAAVPINMFEQPFPENYADIWALTTNGQTTLSLFNLTDKQRTFTVKPEMFGFEKGRSFVVMEWWGSKWLGAYTDEFTVTVPPEDVFILQAAVKSDKPVLFSTSHHHAGTFILENVSYNSESHVISGEIVTKPGLNIVLFGLTAGRGLSRYETHHGAVNSLGGFQKEVTTTSQRTSFTIDFQ